MTELTTKNQETIKAMLYKHRVTNIDEIFNSDDFQFVLNKLLSCSPMAYVGLNLDPNGKASIKGIFVTEMAYSLKESVEIIYHSDLILSLIHDSANHDGVAIKKVSAVTARKHMVADVESEIIIPNDKKANLVILGYLTNRKWGDEPSIPKSERYFSQWQDYLKSNFYIKMSALFEQQLNS